MPARPASAPLAAPTPGPAPAPRARDAWAATLVAFAILVAFAGVRDLWDADEGRYGTVALDMVRSGDLLTPREHGMRFMDKPPLVYWMATAAYAVLGPTPLAARMPCVVCGAALAGLAFLYARRFTGARRAGWCAALVVATSGGGMGFSRTVTMDMGLSAAIAGALYALLSGLRDPRTRWRVAFGACVGAGLLFKGPLVVVATGLVAGAWAALGVSWRATLKTSLSPTAIATALLVAGPWYVLMERANPGYLDHFVTYEHFRRFKEAGHRDFAPVWLYAAVLPLFLVPHTLLLPGARMPAALSVPSRRPVPAQRFAWAWVAVLLVFYSAGRNRLYTYALPIFLPLAVLCGSRLASLAEDGAFRRRVLLAPSLGAALAAAAGLALSFGVVEGVPPSAGWIAAAGALPLALLPLLPLRTARSRIAGYALCAAALWWGVDLAASRFDARRSPRALAEFLTSEAKAGERIVFVDLLPQGLRFRHPHLEVSVAGKQPEIVEPWASRDGGGRLMTKAALDALFSGPDRILVVARARKATPFLDQGGRALARGLSGAQRDDLVVVENRPRAP